MNIDELVKISNERIRKKDSKESHTTTFKASGGDTELVLETESSSDLEHVMER